MSRPTRWSPIHGEAPPHGPSPTRGPTARASPRRRCRWHDALATTGPPLSVACPGSSTSPSPGRSGHRFESSWIGCDRWCLPPADPWDARRRTACEAPIVWTCLECRSPTTETTDRPPGRVWDRGGEDWGGGPGDRDRPARGGKAGRGENALQKSAATHRNTAALLKPLSPMRTEPKAGDRSRGGWPWPKAGDRSRGGWPWPKAGDRSRGGRPWPEPHGRADDGWAGRRRVGGPTTGGPTTGGRASWREATPTRWGNRAGRSGCAAPGGQFQQAVEHVLAAGA